jgi:hypothetical protein
MFRIGGSQQPIEAGANSDDSTGQSSCKRHHADDVFPRVAPTFVMAIRSCCIGLKSDALSPAQAVGAA